MMIDQSPSKKLSLKHSGPLSSSFVLLSEKVILISLSLFITFAIARHLMPSSFGRLSLYMAAVALLSPLMTLGLNSIISRELIQRPDDQNIIVGSALIVRCIAGLSVVIVVSTVSYFVVDSKQEWLLFAVLAVASAFNASSVIDHWLQAHLANYYAAIVRLSVAVLFGIVKLAAVYFNAALSVFIYIFAAELVALGLFYLMAYHYLGGGISRLNAPGAECRNLIIKGRWLFLSGIAAVIYLKVDQVMLGLLVDDRAVGIYAVAAKISEVWYFLPAAVVTSLFPHLINKKVTDPARYRCDLQKINDALLGGAVVVAVAVSVSAPYGLPLLFGESYSESVPVLLIHIWAGTLVVTRAVLSNWCIIENILMLSFISQTLGAVANVGLNLILIPLYGPTGAAFATVASYAICGYLVLFCHKDLWPMAGVVTRSFLLPLRLARYGRNLYK